MVVRVSIRMQEFIYLIEGSFTNDCHLGSTSTQSSEYNHYTLVKLSEKLWHGCDVDHSHIFAERANKNHPAGLGLFAFLLP